MSHLRRMFAVVALALVVAPLLASAPLFDPDEGLHAAIAQEMVQRGDYVTPTFLGEPFLDKPILFFWAEAASLRVFGRHVAAVRLPPLLFGLFGMLTVALLGRALFDESAGLVAGMVYGTMILPMGVSQVAVHDVGVVPFMCIAAWCLVHTDLVASAFLTTEALAKVVRRKILTYGLLAGVALGLSILTKGLVGIVFTGIFAVCLAVRRPASAIRLGVVLAIALVIAVIVAAPWYILMERAHPGYLHYYFVERHLQGYLTATQRHAGRPFWYYLPIVLGGALPWTGYLLGALRSALTISPVSPEPWRGRILWGWFAIGLVFLSIGESKLVTYALPLFPALALIIGEYFSKNPLFKFAFVIHAIALALMPLAGLVILKMKFDDLLPLLWVIIVVLGVEILRTGWRVLRSPSDHRLGVGVVQDVVRMTLIAVIALMFVAPRAAAWMTSRDLAATLNTAGTLPPRVRILDERIGSLIFYLDPPLRAQATADRVDSASFPEAMTALRGDPPDAVFAVRNSQLPRFNRMFPSPPGPDARAGTFTLFRADTLRAAMGTR
jgi:4-amino-4-deoxy-L-arabinose transferase-like glycosyltransferase